MHFHIVTSVWGEKFVKSFLEMTLPNLLSSNNLPAMSKIGQVRYRIFTNSAGREQIECHPLYDQIEKFGIIEILVPFGSREIGVQWHVNWFHRAAAEAKLADACVVFVPPDTLWSDGSFKIIATQLERGVVGIACPFIQVNYDSLLPALNEFITDNTLEVGIQQMVGLALKHIHPLQILGMPESPHTRPAIEMHWPVDRSKMISRYAVRELVAFDPNRCPITYFWYAGGEPCIGSELCFGSEFNDLLMLSVDPINKYFQNYIVGHHLSSIDIARMTLHPLNDTRHTQKFTRQNVDLGHEDDDISDYRERHKAQLAANEIEVGRRALQLISELEKHECKWLAKLLAIAVFETPLLRGWRREEPLLLVGFRDDAWGAGDIAYFDDLITLGNEIKLYNFIKSFVIPELSTNADYYEIQMPRGSVKISMESDVGLTMPGYKESQNIEIEGTTLCIFNGYL